MQKRPEAYFSRTMAGQKSDMVWGGGQGDSNAHKIAFMLDRSHLICITYT
ncbi:MAG TPA: hypothetical protein VFK65_04850 [Candidatus Binatia bacterium]|nr:hypothetical protein [Candidatus Binatia bacterium]